MKKLFIFIALIAGLLYAAKHYYSINTLPDLLRVLHIEAPQETAVPKKAGEPAGSKVKEAVETDSPGEQLAEKEKILSSPALPEKNEKVPPPGSNAAKQRALKSWRTVLEEARPFPAVETIVNPDLKLNLNEKNRVAQIEKDMDALLKKYAIQKGKKYLKDALKAGDEFLNKESKYLKPSAIIGMQFVLTEDAIETKNYAKAKKYLKEIKEKTTNRKHEAVAAYGLACMEEVDGRNAKTALLEYEKVAKEYSYKFITEATGQRMKELKP